MDNRLISIGIVCMTVIGGFLWVVSLLSEEAKADTWSIETVDSADDVGRYTSIELDSNGYPHISYYDDTNSDLKYAKWTGSDWSIETVDSADDVGRYTSIGLDSNGYPHISYYDDTNGDLKYAKWTGDAWGIERVDTLGWVGMDISIALDSNDYAHISYYDLNLGALKYARWTGSDWSIETVDAAGDVGRYTSIALDSSDYAHISYYDMTTGYLRYAKWTGSDWSIETVESFSNYASIALDDSDYPHISYYRTDGYVYTLKYARWTGSAWSIETVDSSGYVGSHTSIALDSSGYPHISYYDWDNADLKYARWAGSAWINQTVDSTGDVGEYTSIALDSSGYAHISYYDITNGDLKYAKRTNNPPTTPTTPSGLTSGNTGTSYTYSTSATDPDDDQVKYILDWDDGTTSETGYVNSGTSASQSHSWGSGGTYYVKAMATDSNGVWSGWSDSLTVTINTPPDMPSIPSGPISGIPGTSYIYLTSATDPDDDQVKYVLDWDDGTTSETGYVLSGDSQSESHSWSSAGTYHVKAMATDINGSSSGWSDSLAVIISDVGNTPPNVPSTPLGPIRGDAGTSYTYSTSTTDPENDQVKYTFDWGDGTTSETKHVSSGASVSKAHNWSTDGIYYVKAMATDINGASSGWSNSLTVAISTVGNTPPNTPSTPSGPTTGETETLYTYSTSATDLDGNQVKYTFDWDDGTTSETGYVISGDSQSESHSWSSAGTYHVKVKATDINGASSGWSNSLKVVISDTDTGENDGNGDDTNGKEGVLPLLLFGILGIIVAIVIILAVVLYGRSKKSTKPTPQYLAQQDPYNQSQYPQQYPQQYAQASPAQPLYSQQQTQTSQISCPKCNYAFDVPSEPRPLKVQCPNCGVEGIMR